MLNSWRRAVVADIRPGRGFRSEAALEALYNHIRAARGGADEPHDIALYNYPSPSGVFAALFANLYHSRLQLPLLLLPFSAVEPFRVEDFRPEGINTCYLLDFIGPKRFALELSQFIPRVIAFDHRHATAERILELGALPNNLELHIDTTKSSSRAVYHYFTKRLVENKPSLETMCLLNPGEEGRVNEVLRYIEDLDLRRYELPDIGAFNIGLRGERYKFNCITNPYLFDQLLEINVSDVIDRGSSLTNSRQDAAKKLAEKSFKIRLGRGVYGECLAVRVDGNSELSHEIAIELSKRSAAAGLRSIGAVVFMQRRNLKMCLRSTDKDTNTSEIAKAYGGGGSPSSSSFIIRMDEYNEWTAVNSS